MNNSSRLLNGSAIISLYGEFPPFEGVEIMDIRIKRDEPCVTMQLSTKEIPKNCPTRWPKIFDEIIMIVSFIGINRLNISGWGRDNIISKFDNIDRADGSTIRISCKNGMSAEFFCEWIRIENIIPGLIGDP